MEGKSYKSTENNKIRLKDVFCIKESRVKVCMRDRNFKPVKGENEARDKWMIWKKMVDDSFHMIHSSFPSPPPPRPGI